MQSLVQFASTLLQTSPRQFNSINHRVESFFQPQLRNVRISSTLLPGLSEQPSPFLQRSPIPSPPLFWTCHIPPPSFQRCQVPPSTFPWKHWLTPPPNIQNCLILSSKKSIIKTWRNSSSVVAKSFHKNTKAIKIKAIDPFLDIASKQSTQPNEWLLSQVTQHSLSLTM